MLAGVAFYALAGLYYLIANNVVDRPAQWSRDPQGFGLGLIFVVALIAIAAARIRSPPRGAGETPRKEHQGDVET